jgi:hypothetical protein
MNTLNNNIDKLKLRLLKEERKTVEKLFTIKSPYVPSICDILIKINGKEENYRDKWPIEKYFIIKNNIIANKWWYAMYCISNSIEIEYKYEPDITIKIPIFVKVSLDNKKEYKYGNNTLLCLWEKEHQEKYCVIKNDLIKILKKYYFINLKEEQFLYMGEIEIANPLIKRLKLQKKYIEQQQLINKTISREKIK